MNDHRRTLLAAISIGIIAVVLAVTLWFSHRVSGKSETRIDPTIAGDIILNTTLPMLDGRLQAFAQWRGRILVVNFWATWCEPCREEMPALVKLQEKYRQKNVQFVGISLDLDDKKQKVAEFMQNAGINYPILIGGMPAMEIARRVGDTKSVLPFTLIVGRSGQVLNAVAGKIEPAFLETVITQETAN